MATPGRSLILFVARAAQRYQNSGLWLPGTKTKHGERTTDKSNSEISSTMPNRIDDTLQADSMNLSEVGESPTRSALENGSADGTEGEVVQEPSESPSPSLSESLSNRGGDTNDESNGETQGSPEENSTSSQAKILANPVPPVTSVGNLVPNTIGDIFQKKVTKNLMTQALLDGHDEIDLRKLADELREFAIEIGARKKAD